MNIELKKRQRCANCEHWAVTLDKEKMKGKMNLLFSFGMCESPKLGETFNGSDSATVYHSDFEPAGLSTGEDFYCINFSSKKDNA